MKFSTSRRGSVDRPHSIGEESIINASKSYSSRADDWARGHPSLSYDNSAHDDLRTVSRDQSPFPSHPNSPVKCHRLRGRVSALMMGPHALKDISAKNLPTAVPAPILYPLTANLIKEHHYEYIDTCHHNHDIYRVEKQRDVSRSSYVVGSYYNLTLSQQEKQRIIMFQT